MNGSCSKVEAGINIDFVETSQKFHHEVTSLDLPSFFLCNFTDAGPAVLPGGKEVFDTVDVGLLIGSLFLSGFFALVEGWVGEGVPFWMSAWHCWMTLAGQIWLRATATRRTKTSCLNIVD